MDNFTLVRNFDNTYTLVIYVDIFTTEFADDFFGKSLKKITDSERFEKYRSFIIKTVKYVFAGGIVITVPFGGFVSAHEDKSYGLSYVYFGIIAYQIENVKKSSEKRFRLFK